MSGLQTIKGIDYQLDITLLLAFTSILNKDLSSLHIEVRSFNSNTNEDNYDVDLIIESPTGMLRIIEIKSGKYQISDLNSCFEAVIDFYTKEGYSRENISNYLVIPPKKIKTDLYPCKVMFINNHINDSFYKSNGKNHIHFEIIEIFCELFFKIGLPRDFNNGLQLLKSYSFYIRSQIDKFANDVILHKKEPEPLIQHKISFNLDEWLAVKGGFCDFITENFHEKFAAPSDILDKLNFSQNQVHLSSINDITKE